MGSTMILGSASLPSSSTASSSSLVGRRVDIERRDAHLELGGHCGVGPVVIEATTGSLDLAVGRARGRQGVAVSRLEDILGLSVVDIGRERLEGDEGLGDIVGVGIDGIEQSRGGRGRGREKRRRLRRTGHLVNEMSRALRGEMVARRLARAEGNGSRAGGGCRRLLRGGLDLAQSGEDILVVDKACLVLVEARCEKHGIVSSYARREREEGIAKVLIGDFSVAMDVVLLVEFGQVDAVVAELAKLGFGQMSAGLDILSSSLGAWDLVEMVKHLLGLLRHAIDLVGVAGMARVDRSVASKSVRDVVRMIGLQDCKAEG